MSNPLYDALVAPLADREDWVLTDGSGRQVTGVELSQMALSAAKVLADLGVGPGERVAVQVDKTPEALALYLGAVTAGVVFLPLNTAYTADEVDYFVGNARASLLIGAPEKADALREVAARHGAKFETLDSAGKGSFSERATDALFAPVQRGEEDLAAILYTSGTTGRSKGAMLTQRNLLSNAEVLVAAWRFTSDDVLLHALPIFHTHGLFVATNVALLSGGKMIFLPGFKLDQVIAHLPQATTMMGVPTFYTRLLDDPRFTKGLVGHMRLFTSGSAPLLAETHRAFEDRTGHRILERYGMTETNMTTSNPYEGERRAGTVGPALPGVDVKITYPETGATLLAGEPGMIEVRGPNVFKGYWEMPEKTREELREDGFFITGDIGVIDEEGYVTIVGRQKDLIITGGYNVYPKEIELILDEQPGVLESAVIGVPHPDFGEAVIAVLVPSAGEDPDVAAITAAMGQSLARFKQPKHIALLTELPRNTMGKVQKNLLRDQFKTLFATATIA
ncbi:malonyl-CoA synthase [Haematobacter massiliensis]|uniref:Malonyl-CoA synthase n=2 Tax=Pseudomonadota TaxID=1224 RepID=A0A086Y6V3_9RHOB|nr:malonyl-CoA synthase [Haematobacter massiliensis]KFI30003.1 malonyl-CoA synthase [Haematobacter massiliensis]OWJ69404.1 malonyl-CoA synthase [Haematobacter massiliensis]OWJ86939.1 malonyl-CoA synthase [Haematobacter massiliensis]QBJ25508.1 malonyl-CoA synthase [Haematobacter massiliensis]